MVSPSRKGLSLIAVMVLIGTIVTISTAMVAVYTVNLNMTQKAFNGAIAEAEAEAGMAELLYRITLEENVNNEAQPPTVSYGLSNETIRGTISPGLEPEEAYHVVTFASGTGFAHSTNNTHLNRDNGSLGRTVPDGMFHVVATGYCRGQFRTIEALVDKPPFPFGLATSGKLHSLDPFVVKGVSSVQNLIEGEEDRPGHILCNSTEGVEIGQSEPLRETYISGFVKSVGPISIQQPAQVLGGLRPNSDISTIASIDVTNFRNAGEPGVVTLLDPHYSNAQQMDIMYYFSGDLLTYQSSVNLNKAMLYVDGDLLIRGPITGEGLIVVNGNATFESGTHLDGANKMAVLASGDVTINGNNNYFAGLVYCGGNFTASNVTIVGNTIVNSSDPEKGKANLQNVKVVSNTETADMTITITSSSGALGQENGPDDFPIGVTTGYFGHPPGWNYEDNGGGGLSGWVDPALGRDHFIGLLKADLWNADPGNFPQVGTTPPGQQMGALWAQATVLYDMASANAQVELDIANLEELKAGAPGNGQSESDLEAQIQALKDAQTEAAVLFDQAASDLVDAIFAHKEQYANGDGTFDDGQVEMDLTIERRFNLNEYLPESERVKIVYWRIHNQRF